MTITHPQHPLCGQQVEIVRIRRGVDPDLIVRLPDGSHAAIAMSSTSYAAPPDHDSQLVSHHLLDFNGLCQVVQLIDHIRQEGRYPTADCEDSTCSSINVDYD